MGTQQDIPVVTSGVTPPPNKVGFYAKTDGNLYSKNDAGAETALGGGSSPSQPANQIVFGTGSGITSETEFTWNPTTNVLQLGSLGTPATIKGPDGVAGDGASLSIFAGNGDPIDGTTNSVGGSVSITAGSSSRRNNGGAVTISGGTLDNDIGGGKVTPIHAGNVSIFGGTLENTVDGSNTVQSSAGNVNIQGGSNTQTNSTGGDVNIFGGGGTANSGGVFIAGSSGIGTGFGGSIVLNSGSNGSGTGDAGSILIQGGLSQTGVSGHLLLHAGYNNAAGAGTPGRVNVLTLGGYLTYSSGDFRNRPPQNDTFSAVTRQYLLRAITTDNTPSQMYLDGNVNDVLPSNSHQMLLVNNSTWRFEIHVVARDVTTDNQNAAYEIKGAIKRDANAASTAIVGTVSYNITATDVPAWDVSVTADTTSGALIITVTGDVADTVRWVAFVRSVEVSE
jgi:hypothetical protein